MNGQMLTQVYALTVRTPVATETDEYNNDRRTWVESPWVVSGIAPGATEEPVRSNRDPEQVAWTVYGPKQGCPPSSESEVRLPGDTEWYPLDGRPRDWTFGPWDNPVAGVVVELQRIEG